jgi:hypothetical protein
MDDTNTRDTETHALCKFKNTVGREDETDGTIVQKIIQGWKPPRRNNEDFMMKNIKGLVARCHSFYLFYILPSIHTIFYI